MLRLIWCLLLLCGLPLSACGSRAFEATPFTLHSSIGPGDRHQGVRLLGALRFNRADIDDLPLCGLSGLAWDEDAGLLYVLSDQGTLFHLQPTFDERGYLVGARSISGYALRDAAGKPVHYLFSDSEGLAIRNGANHIMDDTELLISFEMKPRIVRYSPTGQWRGEIPLPDTLRNPYNYRNGNESLEAVTIDQRWGIITGSEVPLRNDPPKKLIRIFATDGRFWLYPLGQAPGSALVAMDALPNGELLTLERAFVSPLQPFSISLRRTVLPNPQKTVPLSVSDVAIFKSDQGWHLDNFEGLTRYRGARFFMVSDDNCSLVQTTLLVYFELLNQTP